MKQKNFLLTFILCAFIFLPFISSSQIIQWAKGMGSFNNDYGNAICTDAAGNAYTTGMFQGTVDFDPGGPVVSLTAPSPGYNVFVQKLDGSGNFVWAVGFGDTGNETGNTITLDNAGNVYVAGAFEGTVDFDPGPGTFNLTSAGATDIFILKLDAGGNLLWAMNLGGTGLDVANAIKVDVNGDIYATGYFQNTVDFNPGAGVFNLTSAGNYDIFIMKLDSARNLRWAGKIGGGTDDMANALCLGDSSNVYVSGYFNGANIDFDFGSGTANLSSQAYDIFVMKLDSAGAFYWAKKMGGSGWDKSLSLTLDNFNNVYTTGIFYSTADFNPGSGTNNLVSAGNADVFISKLNRSGTYCWAKRIGSSNYDEGSSIAYNDQGFLYLTGGFDGTVDFDPNSGSYNLTTTGWEDIFILKLDTAGNFVLVKKAGGVYNDYGKGIITLQSSTLVYLTGYFESVASFDPYEIVAASGYDIFVCKLDAIVAANTIENLDKTGIYPNPSSGKFAIENPDLKIKNIEVFTIIGDKIMDLQNIENTQTVDLSDQPNGIYLMVIHSDSQSFIKKMIINH